MNIDHNKLRELAIPLLGKWTPSIILLLEKTNASFADLERAIPNISRKILTENLNNLVRMGIINKAGLPSTGFAVTYSLAPLGESLLPIFYELKIWLINNEPEISKNIATYDENKFKESRTKVQCH